MKRTHLLPRIKQRTIVDREYWKVTLTNVRTFDPTIWCLSVGQLRPMSVCGLEDCDLAADLITTVLSKP